MKDFSALGFDFWRYLMNTWSFLFFGAVIYDFTNGTGGELLNIVSIIYVGILAIYVSNKEFERWYHRHDRQHPGEIFVIVWSVLIFVLILLELTGRADYQLPSSVVSAYIAVLTILAITQKSKRLYQSRYPHKKAIISKRGKISK